MKTDSIKIRFNTEKEKTDATLPAWRVLVNGEERLAESVDIQVPSVTSKDHLSTGQIKWHISCEGFAEWIDGKCTIKSKTT